MNALARGLGVEPEVIYDLALGTDSSSVGLPSLPTHFRQKYDLDDDQIKAVERTLARVTKDTQPTPESTAKRVTKPGAKQRSG